MPAGTVVAFSGTFKDIPNGWLPCDGRTLSKAKYPELSKALSGVNDGHGYSNASGINNSDFKIPFYKNCTLKGCGTKTVGSGEEYSLIHHTDYRNIHFPWRDAVSYTHLTLPTKRIV